jgi:hypothetical protein
MSNTFRGTAVELASKIALNGKPLTVGYLSVLTTYGAGVAVVAKLPGASGKGKPSNVLELTSSDALSFTEVVAIPSVEV